MAKYTGPVCRLCRRENMKLFLKGDRCFKDKCSFERRGSGPGQHGQARTKLSEYGIQLREKQKIRRIYGVLERQFRGYFGHAARSKGMTGERLLQFLERRLDNAVYRLGFSGSRAEARQLVNHGHILVNNRKVNIPSYILKAGDVIQVREGTRTNPRIQECIAAIDRKGVPGWLEVDKANYQGRVQYIPTRDEMGLEVSENLVVELYSK